MKKTTTKLSKEELKSGYIMMPWTVEYRTEPDLEYDEFMKEYCRLHAACPKCDSKKHYITLMGYVLNMSDKESYKDKNSCTCLNCSDIHTTHERVEFKNKATIEIKEELYGIIQWHCPGFSGSVYRKAASKVAEAYEKVYIYKDRL